MTIRWAPYEREFLALSDDYGLTADDLARVFGVPSRQAFRLLERARAKDAKCCHRLLETVLGGRA